jgi:hypothetical protein
MRGIGVFPRILNQVGLNVVRSRTEGRLVAERKGKLMKRTLLIALTTVTLATFTACDARKAEIDTQTNNEKEALDAQKEAVDKRTDAAKEQAGDNAQVEKARIEAQQQADKAQIEADKKKVEAEADAAKKEVEVRKP